MIHGTTPAGIQPGDEVSAARHVRQMFSHVAPRYDLLNHLLSFQFDRYWRRFTVEKVRAVEARPEARLLDLCCGTGDLLRALARARCGKQSGLRAAFGRSFRHSAEAGTDAGFQAGLLASRVFGADFCHPMLTTAAAKLGYQARLIEADALCLPVPSESFDLVTVAFGLRNLSHYQRGIEEMYRVLRPDALMAVLEFSQPQG